MKRSILEIVKQMVYIDTLAHANAPTGFPATTNALEMAALWQEVHEDPEWPGLEKYLNECQVQCDGAGGLFVLLYRVKIYFSPKSKPLHDAELRRFAQQID